MYFKSLSLYFAILAVLCCGCKTAKVQPQTEVWHLNSLESIGNHEVSIVGNPKVINVEPAGKAVEFDGVDDGLLVDANPITGAEEFTIEVAFKPYASYPENIEQRFLHIQDPNNESRRILIELRLNNKQEWYVDFFMRTEDASLVLIDSTKTHPVDEWATVALVYQDGQMRGYVNGVQESAGDIAYLPISAEAKTSLGTRMDKRSWFKGAIRTVTFNHEALQLQ
ncbi:LamG domain-containing protein [Pontibacter sp. XAAS-A31]|nr:LamG domain-containing protein [Pontibacter harenae]